MVPNRKTLSELGFHDGWIYILGEGTIRNRGGFKLTIGVTVPDGVINGKARLRAKFIPSLKFEIVEV